MPGAGRGATLPTARMLAPVSVLSSLTTVRGLLIDLDGVVYIGTEAIPGAVDFLSKARSHGLPYLLVTNNSTATVRVVADRLRSMGIQVEPDEILTSAEAAAALVKTASPDGARVLAVGEAGLREALAHQGLEVVDGGSTVDWVVVGLDRAFDYAKLAAATRAILSGARFVATNTDPLLPVERGRVVPGAGSIIAAIRTATGAEPTVVGKPEPGLFQRGLQRLGIPEPQQAAMIGDRIDTDVVGGQRAGLRTVLVLTGLTSAVQVADSPTQPDVVVPHLAALAHLLGWR